MALSLKCLPKLDEVLQTLLNRPRSSYTAIIDENHKKVLIRYSSCFLDGSRRLINDLHNNTLHPDLNLTNSKLVTLEAYDSVLDSVEKQQRMKYWIEYYRSLAYVVLNDKEPVQYTIMVNVYSSSEVHVYIHAVNGRKQLIGSFPDMGKANRWVDNTYGLKRIVERIVKHRSVK